MTTSPESLSDQAYELVERMIVTLELPPGSVFSEGDLSKRVGIGRTPLREALQRLSSDRLVVAVPRRGILVTEINVSEYLSMLETRMVLDRLIAEQAARRATPEERRELREIATSIVEASLNEDSGAFMKLDMTCDRILEKASRNPYAYQAVTSMHAHCRRFWSVHQHHASLLESAQLHATIMKMVANGDSEGAGAASDALLNYLITFTRTALDLD
jgi:DNA-binding GntR family transcriptional regulator